MDKFAVKFIKNYKFRLYIFLLSICFVLLDCNTQASVTVSKDANGVWWFRDGAKIFKSRGVNQISYYRFTIVYGNRLKKKGISEPEWQVRVLERMRDWGFNTIAAWADYSVIRLVRERNSDFYYSEVLKITPGVMKKSYAPVGFPEAIKISPLRRFPDVFSDTFESTARELLREAAGKYGGQKLLGFFSDNELHWSIDMLDRFLSLPNTSEGKQVAKSFVEAKGNRVNDRTREDFLRMVAKRYFSVIRKAFDEITPSYLFLGCRFRWPREYHLVVLEEAAKYVDVVSFNLYRKKFPKGLLDEVYRVTGKPIMISEFSVRARDSGLPNTKGGGLLVDSQKERGKWYRSFVCDAERQPYIVGYHWFCWVDETAKGHWLGQDSNHGLVTIDDRPYSEFLDYVQQQGKDCR
jgi:hypothetical protein